MQHPIVLFLAFGIGVPAGTIAATVAVSALSPSWTGGSIGGQEYPTTWRLNTRTGHMEVCLDIDGNPSCRPMIKPSAQ